jgi:hypothetical protein
MRKVEVEAMVKVEAEGRERLRLRKAVKPVRTEVGVVRLEGGG